MAISLKNTTDIPDQKIREIIEFTRPNGVSNNFNVRVTSSNKKYYWPIPSVILFETYQVRYH